MVAYSNNNTDYYNLKRDYVNNSVELFLPNRPLVEKVGLQFVGCIDTRELLLDMSNFSQPQELRLLTLQYPTEAHNGILEHSVF
jgi:hypothetical protein